MLLRNKRDVKSILKFLTILNEIIAGIHINPDVFHKAVVMAAG
jgi:hypothetical protein